MILLKSGDLSNFTRPHPLGGGPFPPLSKTCRGNPEEGWGHKTYHSAECNEEINYQMHKLSNKAANHFNPHQLGVGVRGGIEAIIHTVRQVMEEHEDAFLMQLDLVNAYNQVDRDQAFKEVEEHFPEMLKWVMTCYRNQVQLIFGNTIIISWAGFHQGDTLVGLLFSLCVHPIIKRINEFGPGLLVNE